MKKLSEVAELKIGCTLTRAKAINETANLYKVLTLKSIDIYGSINKNLFDIFMAENPIKTEFIASRGDVVVRLREPITASYIDENIEGTLVPSLFTIIRVKEEKFLAKYLTLCINSSEFQKKFIKHITGTAINSLSVSDLRDIEINIPSLEFQKKVIEFSENMIKQIDILEKIKTEKDTLYKEYLNKIIKKTEETGKND